MLKIQTAGYSANAAAKSEIRIECAEDPEGLREAIMGPMRGRKPVAVETYDEGGDPSAVKDLAKIRKLLEKRR